MFCRERSGTPHPAARVSVPACPWDFRFFGAVVFLACACVSVFAQSGRTNTPVRLPIVEGTDLRFAHISFGEGPSHSRISAIVEDNRGFLWFGTQDGLRRYDGYRSKEYRHDPTKPRSLSGNFITTMFKDRSGKLWIGSNEYLDLLDPSTEIFTHYRGVSLHAQVADINQDRDGIIWLATNKGLIRLDPPTGHVTRYEHSPGDAGSLGSSLVSSTLEEKDGTFWVATAASLDIFDRKSGRVTQHLRFRGTFPVQLAGPIRLYEDSSGVLWVTLPAWNGLAIFDRHARRLIYWTTLGQVTENSVLSGVRCIHEDEDGALWLGTLGNGLLKLDKQRRALVRYRNNPADPDGLSADRVDSLYEDHEGGIWVGTAGGGVNRFSARPLPFRPIRFGRWKQKGQNLNTITTVYEDSVGALWIATVGALERIDRRTGQSTFYQQPGAPGQASNPYVTSITEDLSGHLWLGTYGGGIRRFDRPSGRFSIYRYKPADPQSLPSDFVYAVLTDHKGTVWAATQDGVAALDLETGRFQVHRVTGEKETLYRGVAEGPDGAQWLGTWDSGVRRFDPVSGQFTIYRQDSHRSGSLSSNQVNALCFDHSGTLWVATATGLNRFNSETGEFTNYDERDGLPNSNVNGILEDKVGNLWLSTDNGISRFDPQVGAFHNYSVSDGLPGNEFYGANAGFKSRSGEMFFSSRAGLVSFFPEEVVDNAYVPPLVLTDFQLFGESVSVGGDSPFKQSVAGTDSLTLNYRQSVFSFEFSALSFASPERNRYRYRLEGLESKWYETDSSRRFVTYTTLPPGHYVFRVQGSNNHRIWNKSGLSVRITILPPWWKTWWFRVTTAVCLLAVVWSAYYLRIRAIKRRNRELTALYSDLQRSQHNLQESEGRLAEAQRIAHVGYWNCDMDADCITWSDETCRIYGVRPQECILNSSRLRELTHPEDQPTVDEALAEVFRGASHYKAEHRVVRPNGEVRFVHAQGDVTRDELGRPHRMFGTVQDISEQKQAEEALRQSQERYRTFFRQNLAGNYISTAQGTLLACNPAFLRMFGFASEDEAKRMSLQSLYASPEEREQFLQQLKERGHLEDYEIEFRRNDGRLLPATENAIGTFSENGELVEIHGFLIDETERRKIEHQLRQAQKMEAVGALAGGIAHDFNNILTIINGYSEIILGDSRLGEAVQRRTQEILKAGQRAASLTRQLLAFSRKQLLQPTVLSLNLVVEDIEKMLRRLIGEHIELVIRPDRDLEPVKADRSQMEQVILNFCVNARDAMPQGGKITIETANAEVDVMMAAQLFPMTPGHYTRLAVSDTGIGMNKQTLARIFEPFFTTKDPERGTGLGLAVVYGIVKQSGGNVFVHSEPGHGSTFSMYLPTADQEAVVREQETQLPEIMRGSETILLVEDAAPLREMMRELLEGSGYTVLEAEDGERAMELANRHEGHIALLLTDIVLPKINGPSLAKSLLQRRTGMKVLYMSGYADNTIIPSGVLKEGMVLVQKPFTMAAIAKEVRALLDGRS
ncbi:MAG: two-component regulator propeller domain-containing protein [Terriglobales bacterium]|jgi:PAS domain S-box-containing protein